MIRVTKESDYAVLLLTYFAKKRDRAVLTTREMAEETGVPFRMTCKLLNLLAKSEFLKSQRGIKGGYRLAREPEKINLREIISALQGPVLLTDCADEKGGACDLGDKCGVRGHWSAINRAFCDALEGVTLAKMAMSDAPSDFRI